MTEYVNVPVPVSRYDEVIALLANEPRPPLRQELLVVGARYCVVTSTTRRGRYVRYGTYRGRKKNRYGWYDYFRFEPRGKFRGLRDTSVDLLTAQVTPA